MYVEIYIVIKNVAKYAHAFTYTMNKSYREMLYVWSQFWNKISLFERI